MREALLHTVLCLGVLLLPAGCSREAVPSVEMPEEEVSLSLSLAVEGGRGPVTRATDAVAQSDSSFRGLQEVIIVPFRVSGEITESEPLWGVPAYESGIDAQIGDDAQGGAFAGLVDGISARLYEYAHFRQQTNAVLVYGIAQEEYVATTLTDSIAYKKRNGVLRRVHVDLSSTVSDMGFSPEPFLFGKQENAYNTWRNNLVNYLNWCVRASVENTRVSPKKQYHFNKPSEYNYHPGLTEALERFTARGSVTPGSQEELDIRLTQLYRDIYPYAQSKHASEDYHVGTYYYIYELAVKILKEINNSSRVTITGSGTSAVVKLNSQAPSLFGLPAGCYALQYREGALRFDIILDNNYSGEDHKVGLYTTDERLFTYPPALYYIANSRLRTSTEVSPAQHYLSSEGTWNNILAYYPDNQVTSKSRAAAIETPLQYALARMDLKLSECSFSSLSSANGSVRVDNRNFPLTGVLVAGQREQDYLFRPPFLFRSGVYRL